MRLRTFAFAALALTLALPVAARERLAKNLPTDRALENLRGEILLQSELARPQLGDAAVALLQERAHFARRLDQLELLAEDALLVLDEALQGGDAGHLLLRSPSAILTSSPDPRTEGADPGRRAWSRGSWMGSPDGAQ